MPVPVGHLYLHVIHVPWIHLTRQCQGQRSRPPRTKYGVFGISQEPLNGFATNSHEDVFGPSLGWVWRSMSKVKVTRDKKRGFWRISREWLNGFAPSSRGRRVLSLTRTSLKVKVNFSGLRAIYVWKNIFALVLFVYEISLEPLNGFVPNSHGRHIWSLTQMSLKVKVKGQGHQEQHFSALSMACMSFMFGKTSTASSLQMSFMSPDQWCQSR